VLTQLAVGKAVQEMFAAHEDFEQRPILSRHRVEGAHRTAVGRRGPGTECVFRSIWITDFGIGITRFGIGITGRFGMWITDFGIGITRFGMGISAARIGITPVEA
jgi:hypothetical protein